MKLDARATVAVILALTVFLFMLSNTMFGYWLSGINPTEVREGQSTVVVEAWLNLTNVLIGGLIGYVMGGFGRDKNGN